MGFILGLLPERGNAERQPFFNEKMKNTQRFSGPGYFPIKGFGDGLDSEACQSLPIVEGTDSTRREVTRLEIVHRYMK
jgi:hypothetical protein